MLDTLSSAEAALPALIDDADGWHSLDIDYHAPFVERLWRPWSHYRISLHRIHPCERSEALFHPHPWPSAMRVLRGRYEMAIGYGPGSHPPPVAARIVGEGDFRYEMTDPDAWHYVRPLGGAAMTVMVTGEPWRREAPRSDRSLRPLDDARRRELFQFFRLHYSRPLGDQPR